MRLTDLDPKWIAHGGDPHAILAFRCPHCQKVWVTCTATAIPTRDQWAAWETVWPNAEDRADIVGCKKTCAWTIKGAPDFDKVTITPSIDGSESGHWHGHVTDGAIA